MNFSREDEQTFAIDLKAVVIPLDDVIKTVVMERPGTGSVVLRIDTEDVRKGDRQSG
jgi:hypothetical protein